MKIAFVLLILVTFALHLYIGMIRSRLYLEGVWKGAEGVSLKQLREVLNGPVRYENYVKLRKLRNCYIVFLVLFWTLFFFVCLQLLIFLK